MLSQFYNHAKLMRRMSLQHNIFYALSQNQYCRFVCMAQARACNLLYCIYLQMYLYESIDKLARYMQQRIYRAKYNCALARSSLAHIMLRPQMVCFLSLARSIPNYFKKPTISNIFGTLYALGMKCAIIIKIYSDNNIRDDFY